MLTFAARRLAAAAVISVVLTFVVFTLQKLSPVDPVRSMVGANASQEAVARMRQQLGLDDPLLTQFWHYLSGAATGDLGTSFRTRRPVTEDLATFLPATAELAATALLLALVLAVLLAVGTSLRWPGAQVLRLLLVAGASAPSFLLGIALVLLFYVSLDVLPASGRTSLLDAPTGPTGLLLLDGAIAGRPEVVGDAAAHLVLPALAVAVGPAVAIGRVLRSSLLGEEQAPYVRTARSKGLTEGDIVRRHVLRNAVGPALSMTGLQLGLMFAGVLVIEQIFAWPGIGRYTAQSIGVADFPAIAGVTLVLGVGYVAVNAVVDVLQGLADPRITTS